MDLDNYEKGFIKWMQENKPDFPIDKIEFDTIKSCWIDECEYDWVYLWVCADYVEDLLLKRP